MVDLTEISPSAIQQDDLANELNKLDTITQPSYRVVGEAKIPVSKQTGKLWSTRKRIALRRRRKSGTSDAWNEAIRYFKNDQTPHRRTTEGEYAGNESTKLTNDKFTSTENVVFSNAASLVPSLYAKNPTIEITPVDEVDEAANADLITVCEKLINTLNAKKGLSGLNLRPKVKRAITIAHLTNRCYAEVNYVTKESSSQKAEEDLIALAKELEQADSANEIVKIEGKIRALEETVAFLLPEGPQVRIRMPQDVIIDPACKEEDLADASWIMVREYIPASYIRARFYDEKRDGSYKSIYEPTHIVSATTGGDIGEHEAPVDGLVDWSDEKSREHKNYGYDDQETFNSSTLICVWKVWDKVTRRVLWFNDKEWTWPIWVWNDIYQLDGFFNVFPLWFFSDPEGEEGRGEVSYYLDQQDAINAISTERNKLLAWARRKIFFNTRAGLDSSTVSDFLSSDDPEKCVVGVELPEGAKFDEVIFAPTPPNAHIMEMFDKNDLYEAINRITAVGQVLRGEEFKTNTTNQAIATYNSTQQTRLDERIDAVEEFIGAVSWAVLQLCLQLMPPEVVAEHVGSRYASVWRNMSAAEIRGTLQLQVSGGSSLKPTSSAKQKVALEIGQVLGQFVNAAPQAVLSVMLKVFEQAFDEVVITKDDWQSIRMAIGGGGPTTSGGQPQQGGVGLDQIMGAIDQMPPELRAQLGQAIAQGVPVQEAIQGVLGNANAQPQTQEPQNAA